MQEQPTAPPPAEPGAAGAPPAPQRSAARTWGLIAAVVSAAAGVASAIAAFMAGGGSGPAATPAPAPPAQATFTASGSPTAPTAPGAGASGTAAAVRWAGKVRFGLAGIDLAEIPPRARNVDDTLGGSIFPSAQRSGGSGMKIKGQVAPWDAAGAPTAEGCRDLLLTQPRREVEVLAGDRVCVVDDRSPIGLVTVTATHYDDGSYGELEADLTVWSLTLGR
ncbi:hypothetical protein [Kitasatospora sp. NPDC004531]